MMYLNDLFLSLLAASIHYFLLDCVHEMNYCHHLYGLQFPWLQCPIAGVKGEIWPKERSGWNQRVGRLNVPLILQTHLVRMRRVHKDILYVQSVKGEDALWTHTVPLHFEFQTRLLACDITVGHAGEGCGSIRTEDDSNLCLGVGPNLPFLQKQNK